ncbi:M50 family metallopeptidase [Acetobacterium woodii]|uniref:Putative metalloprotease n=1 Tax=Acetobacterium woodii (strain ATCC 29683 / DSM 1030 / JCM 2381 / KCTC 1655 / WB1) TaxID=931626 RepID=H6LE71_ACEWD|nr:site-2 protease family protein [Acetobacterium woodii]AFA49304.1 putative metalloprotease [Acetobacterium woodii DSM 1030]
MNLYTILITLLILCVLVVVHEFGHFIVAKKTGIFVEEFAIGMGPKLFGHQGKETLFSIRAFPVGGFCKMRGEEPEFDDDGNLIPRDPSVPIDPRSFEAKSRGKKLLVLVAGSAMNIIFAMLCLVVIALFSGHPNIFDAIRVALLNTWRFSGLIFQSFGMLFTGQVGLDQLAGPIGMVSMVNTFLESGVVMLFAFTAMLSVNLAIINLFPLPALDGGRIFIILIEIVSRRKLKPELEMKINYFGFMALIALAILIAFNDVMRLAS